MPQVNRRQLLGVLVATLKNEHPDFEQENVEATLRRHPELQQAFESATYAFTHDNAKTFIIQLLQLYAFSDERARVLMGPNISGYMQVGDGVWFNTTSGLTYRMCDVAATYNKLKSEGDRPLSTSAVKKLSDKTKYELKLDLSDKQPSKNHPNQELQLSFDQHVTKETKEKVLQYNNESMKYLEFLIVFMWQYEKKLTVAQHGDPLHAVGLIQATTTARFKIFLKEGNLTEAQMFDKLLSRATNGAKRIQFKLKDNKVDLNMHAGRMMRNVTDALEFDNVSIDMLIQRTCITGRRLTQRACELHLERNQFLHNHHGLGSECFSPLNVIRGSLNQNNSNKNCGVFWVLGCSCGSNFCMIRYDKMRSTDDFADYVSEAMLMQVSRYSDLRGNFHQISLRVANEIRTTCINNYLAVPEHIAVILSNNH